jgi:hypothetical protein
MVISPLQGQLWTFRGTEEHGNVWEHVRTRQVWTSPHETVGAPPIPYHRYQTYFVDHTSVGFKHQLTGELTVEAMPRPPPRGHPPMVITTEARRISPKTALD